MMKLVQLHVSKKGSHGLSSDILLLGKNITQLYGENGCGKSPIIQSILYCLGYPSVFRDKIYENCEYAILKVIINDVVYTIKRLYEKNGLNVEVSSQGINQKFYNESEFSEYIFKLLHLRYESLVSSSRKRIEPYLSTILPIFYLNQETGYTKLYSPKNSFIQNQFSEMIRLIFDLPIKNAFDIKKQQLVAKSQLESTEKKLIEHKQKIDIELKNLSVQDESTENIRKSIDTLEKEIDILRSSGANSDDSVRALDRLIIFNSNKMQELQDKINFTEGRRRGVSQIISEIEIEVETLTLNESARRIFHSFDEICGTQNCQMFSKDNNEYSKNLLYLKDQIKDLERNDKISGQQVAEFLVQKKALELATKEIESQKKEVINKSEISGLIKAIEGIKNKIFELQIQLFEIERIEKLQEKNFEYVMARDRAREKYDSFSHSSKPVLSIIRFKKEMTVVYMEWLKILNTPNIDKDISFDDDFKPIFGNEKMGQLKGSTLTRAVLAYHAALFNLMCVNNSISLGFLIFDTPRQHELNYEDLDAYFRHLKNLCIKYEVQIVFSTSTYLYEGDSSDVNWIPKYVDKDDNKLKFLKTK